MIFFSNLRILHFLDYCTFFRRFVRIKISIKKKFNFPAIPLSPLSLLFLLSNFRITIQDFGGRIPPEVQASLKFYLPR